MISAQIIEIQRNNLMSKVKNMSEQEIFEAIYVDELTGILNRKAFNEYAYAYKYVAIIDADSLKWVNDNFGHREGDELICNIAQVLESEFGCSAYRIAGDEFAVTAHNLNQLIFGLKRAQHKCKKFSYGVGNTLDEADERLKADKAERESLGFRASRGEKPQWA